MPYPPSYWTGKGGKMKAQSFGYSVVLHIFKENSSHYFDCSSFITCQTALQREAYLASLVQAIR
jgi:hypothetical protein